MGKGKIILRKFKTIGVSFLLFFVGAMTATAASPTPDGYTELLNEKNALTKSIEEQGSELVNKENEIIDLLALKDELKLEEEVLAKKEEALAKAEKEKKAQEEEEKRKQEEEQKLQASANNNSTNVSSNSGGGDKNSASYKPSTPSKPQNSTLDLAL